ncbi:MAG: PEP-CTERM sorting domain-containing protein [Armatimonadetes bacterium]|nr:PEP-CTERM sorting domain-containing protein [Armatimonadota bacterium]
MTLKQTATFATLFFIGLVPLTAYAQTFTYTSATGGSIPGNNAGGVSSTISVPDNFVSTDFTSVTITGLNHTFVGDLIITLSHGGTTVDILDRVRGDGGATFGDSSNLGGDYTFVTTSGANFNAATAAGGDAARRELCDGSGGQHAPLRLVQHRQRLAFGLRGAECERRVDAFGNSGFFYDLSGTLTDGTNLLETRFFDADGGLSIVGENPGALFLNGVAVVPEPTTFALLGVGVAAPGGFVTRRKRRD